MTEGPIGTGWAEYRRDLLDRIALGPASLALLERTFYAGAVAVLITLAEDERTELLDEVEAFIDARPFTPSGGS